MSTVTGMIGNIKCGGLIIGSVGKWKFAMKEEPLEVSVDSYYLNQYWYVQGQVLELWLKCGKGFWVIESKIQGFPCVGKQIDSRIKFESVNPPHYISQN